MTEPTLAYTRPVQVMAQTAMAGDDWLSDRDRKRHSRAEAVRKKTALACAKRLEAAARSVSDYLSACRECNDGSDDTQLGTSDGRHRLIADCMEYAGWLESVYGGNR